MGAIVPCTLARAVASSLFNVQSPVGADGDTLPTHEVERDHRCFWVWSRDFLFLSFFDRSDSRSNFVVGRKKRRSGTEPEYDPSLMFEGLLSVTLCTVFGEGLEASTTRTRAPAYCSS